MEQSGVYTSDHRFRAEPGKDNTVNIYSDNHLWLTYYGHQEGLYKKRGTVTDIQWIETDGCRRIKSTSSTGSIQLWDALMGYHLRTYTASDTQRKEAISQ